MYHKPKYVLLDEFTSSVDSNMEIIMYESLLKLNCTYMSVAHRDTVKKYHNVEMKILNDSTFSIINLNENLNFLEILV